MSARFDGWRSLRELDAQAGAPKGTAFRAFKRLSPAWTEGKEYRVLSGTDAPEAFDALRATGRLYGTSRVAILIAPGAATEIVRFIASKKGGE